MISFVMGCPGLVSLVLELGTVVTWSQCLAKAESQSRASVAGWLTSHICWKVSLALFAFLPVLTTSFISDHRLLSYG